MFGIGHSVYGSNGTASDVSVLCGGCVGRVYMSTSVQCILPPLITLSPADSPQNDDSILNEGMLSLPCRVLLSVTVTVRGHSGAFLGLHVPYTIYLHARRDSCPLHSTMMVGKVCLTQCT